MPHSPKIATCCYCGTRAALVLKGDVTRHELSCSACGAPLHELKRLKTEEPRPRAAKPAPVTPKPKKASKSKPKKRKSRTRWFLEEVVDLVEDVFD